MKHAVLWWRINDWMSNTMQVILHSMGVYEFNFNMVCASFTSLRWITIALSLLFLVLLLGWMDCLCSGYTARWQQMWPFHCFYKHHSELFILPNEKNFSFGGSRMGNISSIYSLNKFCLILDVLKKNELMTFVF